MRTARFLAVVSLLALTSTPLRAQIDPATPPASDAELPLVRPEYVAPAVPQAMPRVLFQTSMGDITMELNPEKAPLSVANFLRYVNEAHFDGTVIYRVAPGFVLQMGSYLADGNAKATHEPIMLEANNGLSNLRGTISMARDTPHSATAEFFINLADNLRLDQAPDDTANETGYAVFGQVISGMEVVDAIAMVPRGDNGPFPGAAPVTPILITKASVIP
jgi:peptidyl-prolyl cis-trans isomerase A (cyclophilin A)/peptidyl-prolyl cis-trans isomerase B (cyclophilin B)